MLLLAALQLCGCGEEGAPTPTRRIILLPDTQCYTRYAPEILEAQTDWIRSGWERLNIVHVAHLGDITDTGLQHISKLESLVELILCFDNITKAGHGHVKHMELLDMSYCHVV